MSMSKAQEAAEAAFFEALDEATAINVKFARYYAAGIVGIVALFTLVHWSRIIFTSTVSRQNPIARAITVLTTPIRRLQKGYAAGSTLILPGRIVLFTTYFGINVALMFPRLTFEYHAVFLAKRCGWLALCNLCLTIFLALKNTPLSPLAGKSYESINVLHRCAGYTTIVAILLHGSLFVSHLVQDDSTTVLMMPGQYAAVFAAFCAIAIGITASRFFRKGQYELFFIVHVTLVIGILIALIFHLKQINWSAIAALTAAASMWFADRTLRFSRWLFYGYGNYCKLTPLPEGATKVTMQRSIKAQPGSHAFLWIPSIRRFQTHPFTLVSNNPAEFVIAAHDGFTKDLHMMALENPKALRRAAIEGPYGNVPSTADYDKVLLIGGGSGATFTLALAMDWLRRNQRQSSNRILEFVWSIKTKDYLEWFEHELADLQSSPLVNLKIHVTANNISKSDISLPSVTPSPLPSPLPSIYPSPMPSQLYLDTPNYMSDDSEKALVPNMNSETSSKRSSLIGAVDLGRPKIDTIVREAVEATSRDCRVLVAASGPGEMLATARTAVKACMSSQSAGIEMHLEEFDW